VPQGSIIFFGLLIGFVVYVTDKGELASYLSVFGLKSLPSNQGGGVVATANTIPEQSGGSSGISLSSGGSGGVQLGSGGTSPLGNAATTIAADQAEMGNGDTTIQTGVTEGLMG
jgi:hypothetical protein